MNRYELVYIVDAHLPAQEKDEVTRQMQEGIQKLEGKIINSSVWLEKHRFSFPMKRVWEGSYYLVNFDAPAAAVGKLRQNLRLNERLLRHLIIRLDE